MSWSALFHKFGKQTCLVGCFPFGRNMAENSFALGFSCPIRNYFVFIGVDVFLAYCITLQFACVQNIQIFHTMAGQFREGWHAFGSWTAFANNQFAITNINGFFAAMVEK